LLLEQELLGLSLLVLVVQGNGLVPLLLALALRSQIFRQSLLGRVELLICSKTKYFGSGPFAFVSSEFLTEDFQHEVKALPLIFGSFNLEFLQELVEESELVVLEALFDVVDGEGVLECLLKVVGFVLVRQHY
jgi:hypothetical protein